MHLGQFRGDLETSLIVREKTDGEGHPRPQAERGLMFCSIFLHEHAMTDINNNMKIINDYSKIGYIIDT